jgi:hypothetical protein
MALVRDATDPPLVLAPPTLEDLARVRRRSRFRVVWLVGELVLAGVLLMCFMTFWCIYIGGCV